MQPLVAAATGPGGSTDVPVFLPGPAGVSSGGAGDMCQQPDLPGPVPVAPPGGKKAAKVAQQPKANKKQQQQHLQQGTDLAAAAAEFEAVAHAANGQAVNQPLPSHVDVLSAAAVAAGVSPTTLNKQVINLPKQESLFPPPGAKKLDNQIYSTHSLLLFLARTTAGLRCRRRCRCSGRGCWHCWWAGHDQPGSYGPPRCGRSCRCRDSCGLGFSDGEQS